MQIGVTSRAVLRAYSDTWSVKRDAHPLIDATVSRRLSSTTRRAAFGRNGAQCG
jgi:hypothetical protein